MHDVMTRAEEIAMLRGALCVSTRGRDSRDVQAALALLFDTGMRRGELVLCNREDRNDRWARVPTLKANRVKPRPPLIQLQEVTRRLEIAAGDDQVIDVRTVMRAVADEEAARYRAHVNSRSRRAAAGQLSRADVRSWRTISLTRGAQQAWAWLARDGGTGPLLVGGSATGRISPQAIGKWWKSAAKIANVRPGRDGLSCHSARVTCATRMHMAGVSSRTVQAFLGHAKLSSTESYLRVHLDDISAAVERMDSYVDSL